MTGYPLLSIAVTVAVVYLLVAYALGGPFVLVQLLVHAVSRRRQRHRSMPDDVLASSRFTIPVSVVMPTVGMNVADAVHQLLLLNYPEFEVIIVNNGARESLDALRERFSLSACEVFYRRTLPTPPVRAIFRSTSDPRLLVIDCPGHTHGDALNVGVNLGRYRYVCCADKDARYTPDALLVAMRAAMDDPATVVGVTTSLAALDADPTDGLAGQSTAAALRTLSNLRGLLARNNQRRLGLSLDVKPGFTLWRRDVVVDAGGFATDASPERLEMTVRAHRHLLRARVPYQILHVAEPVGSPRQEPTLGQLIAERRQRHQAMARILWRYRGMLFNPRYGRIGLVNLPQYLFDAVVVPWLELACLVALPFAAVVGVLSPLNLFLVIAAIGFGNGVLLNTAMLLAPWPPDDRSQMRLLALGPFEVFVWRPVQLYSRLLGLVTLVTSARGDAAA